MEAAWKLCVGMEVERLPIKSFFLVWKRLSLNLPWISMAMVHSLHGSQYRPWELVVPYVRLCRLPPQEKEGTM